MGPCFCSVADPGAGSGGWEALGADRRGHGDHPGGPDPEPRGERWMLGRLQCGAGVLQPFLAGATKGGYGADREVMVGPQIWFLLFYMFLYVIITKYDAL